MELQDYIRILRRRGWIIILLMVLTATGAFAFSKLQTEIYESTVEILVQPARTDLGLTQSVKWLLRSYVAWMNTDTQALEVINLLSLDREPGSLRSDVKMASDDSRLVIQITVENPDGDLANDIAQAWTDLFVQWRNAENAKQRREDQVDAIQLDPPRYGLARPKWKINVVAGAVMGALVGIAIVFILEWIESGVVRRPEDIQRFLDLPSLGAIPTPKLDTSRPYLLGGRGNRPMSIPTAIPMAQTAAPLLTTSSPQASSPPSVASKTEPVAPPPVEVAEAELPPVPETTPDLPPAPAAGEEEVGPIEPTILLSKGDEL